MTLTDRFLKYVSFDTRSDPDSGTYPSTAKQLALLNYLVGELAVTGMEDVDIDPHGYVTATLPATAGRELAPVIGLLAHVDTSPDMSGADIRPQFVRNYDGGDITLSPGVIMRVSDFTELQTLKGHDLIVTDGTTLLGADDKAGIAEIITAMEYLISRPDIPHGKVRIAFTPDEEIGRGVDFFDVAGFGADFAYTVDGGPEGELEYENFNAAGAVIEVQGRNIHPGYAKDRMLNALRVLQELDAMLPGNERPENTEGYEGFFHLASSSGSVEKAKSEYIIRDHDRQKFEARKRAVQAAAAALNEKYGDGTVALTLRDQYYNMREMVEARPEVIARATEAMRAAGVVPVVRPIRGGTDGARLSYMGLPCPNLFTGGGNFHGKFEYVSLTVMQRAVDTIVALLTI